MKQTCCPVCGDKPDFEPTDFEILRCAACSVDWSWVGTNVEPAALYSDEVYRVVDNRKSIFERIILYEGRKVLSQAARLLGGQKGALLDFGCGKGQFLLAANNQGWKARGVETSTDRATFAREKYGVDVLTQYYERGELPGSPFNLITMNHVLEHLPSPIHLTETLVRDNLASDGVLYVEVPRINSWQAKIGGKQWVHLDIPKHLTHWRKSLLAGQFLDLGYSVVAERRFSIHLGVLGMLQSLMARTGYRGNIIVDLKRQRSFGLLSRVALLLPLAAIMELFAVPFGKTGIVGLFFMRSRNAIQDRS